MDDFTKIEVEFYLELKLAYQLALELTNICNAKSYKNAARLNLAKWIDKVSKLAGNVFRNIVIQLSQF